MNALAILPETGQVPKWKVINIEPDHVEVQLPDTNLIMSVSKTQLLFPAKVVPGMSIDLMVIPDGLSEKAVAYKWLAGLECIAGTIATVQRDHSRRSGLFVRSQMPCLSIWGWMPASALATAPALGRKRLLQSQPGENINFRLTKFRTHAINVKHQLGQWLIDVEASPLDQPSTESVPVKIDFSDGWFTVRRTTDH